MSSATEKSLKIPIMRIVNKAISISPRVSSWLKNSHRPRALQVFAPVVNLVNEDGEVLSIVVPAIGNGPFTMVVEKGKFDQHIDQASNVQITNEGISIDEYFVEVGQPGMWNPFPDWNLIRDAEFDQWVPPIKNILKEEATDDSIAKILFGLGEKTRNKFAKTTKEGISEISAGLIEGDLGLVRSGAGQLAGLGIGLTPAGDDFLVGVMHGVWASYEADWANSVCKVIIGSAAPRTNTLSTAWLRAVANGEAGEVWHDLFGAMVAGDQDKLEKSVRRILPTGHTSGADALAGFTHALSLEDQ
jgi:hypothetical protein